MKSLVASLILLLSVKLHIAQSPAFKAFPNPFSQQLNFQFTLDSNAVVSIHILDVFGRNVALALPDTQLASGFYQFPSNLNFLNAGVYLVNLSYNSKKQAIIVTKLDSASFNCPIGNVQSDTLRLNITVVDSLGDTINYHIYNRWGQAVAGLDTVLQPGNYVFEFILDSFARGTYVQRFEQDSNNCIAQIVLLATTLLNSPDNSVRFQKNGNFLTVESRESLIIRVFNNWGQKVLESKENLAFYLPDGLHFIFIENNYTQQSQMVKWWQSAE